MKYTLYFRFLAAVFLCAALMPASQPTHAEKGTLFFGIANKGPAPTIFVVNSNGDVPDSNPGNGICEGIGGVCTLRAAIQESNAHIGAEEITFLTNYTIKPGSMLPTLADNIGIVGGGHTIVLDGVNVPSGGTRAGITLGSYDYVQGITIQNFDYGVITGGAHNLIGTNGDGVNDAFERNIIVSNDVTGVQLAGDYNHVAGNYIGLNSGSSPMGNGLHGVLVYGVGNIIGADGSNDAYNANERNVISCNGRHGIHLRNDGAEGNIIAGNYIGISVGGALDRGNVEAGINIDSSGTFGAIRIGTNGDGIADDVEGNVISGNGTNGITVAIGSSGTKISGNKIGTNASGNAAIANSGYGILVTGSTSYVQIGTNGDGVGDSLEGNVISGNTNGGIYIQTSHNSVAGNKIGTNAAGDAAISNGADGITLDGVDLNVAGYNTVGISAAGHAGLLSEKNLISGNEGCGVYMLGENADANIIAGNYIGTNAAGDTSIYNSISGVCISGGGDENVIGSNLDGTYDAYEGNLISGNFTNGIQIFAASDSIGTRIVYNNIGTSAEGWAAVPNGGDGIQAFDGTVAGIVGNVIGWNGGDGMDLRYLVNSSISENYIGINPEGGSMPNTGNGIYLGTSAQALTISGNSIAYNGQNGIYLGNGTGLMNRLAHNSIHTNGGLGIDLYPAGVTANDNLDPDTGANNLQNYPVPSGVSWVNASSVHISGSFNSIASQTFVISVYGSPTCDPSGYGEGAEYMAEFAVVTDGSGNSLPINQDVVSSGNWTGNPFITLMTTDMSGNTSEFSQCVELELKRLYLPMVSN